MQRVRASLQSIDFLTWSILESRVFRVSMLLFQGNAWMQKVVSLYGPERTRRSPLMMTCGQVRAQRSLKPSRQIIDFVRETNRTLFMAIEETAFDSVIVLISVCAPRGCGRLCLHARASWASMIVIAAIASSGERVTASHEGTQSSLSLL